MAMNIEKSSTKFIKPFVPTPPTLGDYKLGFIDEFIVGTNVGIVLFFSANRNHNPKFVANLEKSLEETLTRFYPLAGRYDDETQTIKCNDQGAEFISAKVNIKLQDILVSEGQVNFIDEFIPSKIGDVDKLKGSLLATQVTTFECGGLALAVNASHILVDASTLGTFLHEWAITNREENETDLTGRPGFNSSSLFPARGLRPYPLPHMSDDMTTKYIRKKFSFSENVISNLKANRKNSTRQWSKVQLVSAIVWKAFMAVDRATYNCHRESILLQPINLREKMASFIPKNSCGNIWGFFVTKATTHETTEELADRISDSVKKTICDFSRAHHDSEEGQTMVLNCLLQMGTVDLESTNVTGVTSWCKFPFYEADFGFGKPIWAAPGTIQVQNSAFFLDDLEGNGLDAYVFMKDNDFPVFEEALDVKAFTA